MCSGLSVPPKPSVNLNYHYHNILISHYEMQDCTSKYTYKNTEPLFSVIHTHTTIQHILHLKFYSILQKSSVGIGQVISNKQIMFDLI